MGYVLKVLIRKYSMKIRIPSRLVSGDIIAITAPSSGVPAYLHPRLDLAISALWDKGFRVIEGRCLRHHDWQKCRTERQRC